MCANVRECVCVGENVKMQGNIVQVRNKRLSECLFHIGGGNTKNLSL